MAEDTEERVITIPLRKLIIQVPRTQKAPRAIKAIKSHVAHHMKTKDENVWLDTPVNEIIWKRGIENPPAKLKVKATRFKDQDLVEVSIPED